MNLSRLIISVAIRNLALYKVRTLTISCLIGFGSFLAVTGASLLLDIKLSMRESITESVTGDLQVYSSLAKDELAIFGSGFMGRADIGSLPDYAPLAAIAQSHPNVKAFVPMGLEMALISRGNDLDDLLSALREARRQSDDILLKSLWDQIRFQLEQLKNELQMRRQVTSDLAELEMQMGLVDRSLSWTDPNQLGEMELQFLEAKISPLSGEKSPIYLSYFATDIERYKAQFSKFKVIEGSELPPGHRGLMLGRKVREEQLKNKVARLFDKLKKRVFTMGLSMEKDDEARRDALDLIRQYDQIISALNREEAESLSKELIQFGIPGNSQTQDLIQKLTGQITEFLTVNDTNLKQRFDWFYAHIAPRIKLYAISPGDTIVLRSYTKSGYIKALPVKVYGVFGFDGLENADLAGGLSLLDLVSFRELYGQMTQASQEELKEMRAQIRIEDVPKDKAEEALFGSDRPLESSAPEEKNAEQTSSSFETIKVTPVLSDLFDTQEVTKGLALSGAIRLRDPTKTDQTLQELKDLFAAQNLSVKVVDWQKAAGLVGQFVNVVGGVLVFAIVVIFVVALVMINNSIVVSTLERVKEIGTMRAIGAQKSFVLGMVLTEAGLSGLLGAVGGTLLALVLLVFFSIRGLRAFNDFFVFLFAGPRLYPHLYWNIIVGAPLIVGLCGAACRWNHSRGSHAGKRVA
jgi:ABC-type lipoprotein release transport system permease subunit